MAGWYDATVFNIHMDHHATPEGCPDLGAGFDPEQFRRLLRAVKPDMIQYHSAGHPGWALVPTEVGVTCPTLKRDFIADWARVCREEGVKFGFYMSTGYNDVAGRAHPEWQRIAADGNPYPMLWGNMGLNLCFNSPYVEKWVIPFLIELIERYDSSHFWFDGDVWAVRPCWCPWCVEGFKKKYGEEPPRDEKDARVVSFQFDSFLDFHRRVKKAITAKKPDVLLCGNWAYTRQHGAFFEPDGTADWISGDISFNSNSWRSANAEATYISTVGMPWDLMNFDQFATDMFNLQTVAKKAGHIKSEVTSILAHGGRLFYWNNPIYKDASLWEYQWKIMAEVADFVRPIAAHTIGNESTARVGVYLNTDAHAIEPATFNPMRDRTYMVNQALTEAHYPHEIVNDRVMPGRLAGYDLVIIPQAAHVKRPVYDAITRFVEAGGTLLYAGCKLPETDGSTAPWEELLGIVSSAPGDVPAGLVPLHGSGFDLHMGGCR